MTRPAKALILASTWLAIGALLEARAQQGDGPRLWAVVVSVEDYASPVPDRPGLNSDGRQLALWMTRTAGWGSDHVLELNDNGNVRAGKDPAAPSPALQANLENLDWAMNDWLGTRARKGDVVLLAFAGRGASIDKQERLLPIDYRVGQPGWSPERAIGRLLRERECSAVLTWVDAPMLDPAAPGVARAELGDQLLGKLSRWRGSSAWLATGEAGSPVGSAFAASLRASLGDGHRALLASLTDLNRDPQVRPLRFRHLGGVPPGLTLARDRFQVPRPQKAELLVQKGHSDRVTAIAIRGDGRLMASSSLDSTIRVWDLTADRRELLRVLPEFLNGVTTIALSPDGRYLVGGDGMGEVLAWDLSSTNTLPIVGQGMRPHANAIESLTFLPEEPTSTPGKPGVTRFVSVGQDGRSEVWEIAGRVMSHRNVLQPGVREVLVSAASRPIGPEALASIGDDSLLNIFDRALKQPRKGIMIPGGRVAAMQVDSEGRWAVVASEAGQVKLVHLATGVVAIDRTPNVGPIKSLRIGPGQLVAIGSGDGLYLLPVDQPEKMARLDSGRSPIESIEFSLDGGWLAARNNTGDLFAWKLVEGRNPEPVRLDRSGGGLAAFSSLSFSPVPGRPMLVAGENDGGVRRWDLSNLKEYPRLAPHRGQVRRVSSTPDGRHLLQILEDGTAQVWDLKEGRSVQTLEGSWSSGAFLPDGRLAMARHANEGGGLAVVEARQGKAVLGLNLAIPANFSSDLGRVVVSKDGRRVAASSAPGRDEAAFVWDLPGASPRVFTGHVKPLTAVDFSDDGGTLLTAAEDGSVRLWDLDGRDGSKWEFRSGTVDAITAARLAPGKTRRVLAAGLSPEDVGQVLYWDGKLGPDGQPGKPSVIGQTAGAVLSVAFLGDGRFAAAAGRDGRILFWGLTEGRAPERLKVRANSARGDDDFAHHHTEAINDLLSWPQAEGPSVVSASDDSTVRFWKIEPEARPAGSSLNLLGTLTGASVEAPAPVPRPPVARTRAAAPWVAFTPDGVYDASLDGERLVSFSDGRGVDPLDQYAPRLFRPLLTDEIRRGGRIIPNPYTPPPPLLIEAPEDRGPTQAEAEIRVSLEDLKMKVEDLRLYLNDLPVRAADGFRQTSPGEFVARVTLAQGDNRLYAMAGRLDDADARSKDLILFHAGPDVVGRLHVISLGVGGYRRNALSFPVDDARDFAEFIQGHGVGAGKASGERIFLTDAQVNAPGVQQAFDRVRRQVKGHPEDTVVVFLAGHADILNDSKGRPTYSLLLPKFPFPEADPALVAFRGAGVAALARRAPEGTYLPYSTIYRNFSDLDALQRLVIVDACQAESVLEDPGVRLLDQVKAMDRETRQSRTNYFFASRKGEAAGEAKVLNHGLLTYVMLRGMGDPKVVAPPEAIAEFRQYPSADLDRDGVITTRELHVYVDRILPPLAEHLAVAARGPKRAEPIVPPGPVPKPRFADPRVEASGPSFPLVAIPLVPVPGAKAGGGAE